MPSVAFFHRVSRNAARSGRYLRSAAAIGSVAGSDTT
jgi:hypothetical protein